MTSKSKSSRIQADIEKCRIEGSWNKAAELIKQLTSKNAGADVYVPFIQAESVLEIFAKGHSATEQNISAAKNKLDDVEKHLNTVINEHGQLQLEATLLLAKVKFYQGSYQAALTLYDDADIDKFCPDISSGHANNSSHNEKLPSHLDNASPRMLHILAEAYAFKGLSLEKLPLGKTSKFKTAEKEAKILKYFQIAGDLTLFYLQEKEKAVQSLGGVSQTETEGSSVGEILEMVIQQSPKYYIKHGELDKGIKRFRDLLSAVDTKYSQHLRLILAKQLADVLLRGVCDSSYKPPEVKMADGNSVGTVFSPKKYSQEKAFIPQNQLEESLLLLLIAEAVATRETILNRTVEHKEGRLHTLHNAEAVFDLLAMALVKSSQFSKLVDSFERAMKYSFEEFHIWQQFAYSLICDKQYARSIQVLKECHRLRPTHIVPILQAAKLCYEQLHMYDEGLELAKLALKHAGDTHPMSSRMHVALGIGYSLKAMEMKLQGNRMDFHQKALKAFQRAHLLDPNDYLAVFHLALQMALLRQIEEATMYIKLALKYYGDHIHSLHLLVLLLTSHKLYQDAFDVVNAALQEYPDNISLLFTKCKIEEVLHGPEVALYTCKKMMKLWKSLNEIHGNKSEEGTLPHPKKTSLPMNSNDRSQFEKKSQAYLQLNEFADRDGGSVRADSLAITKIEQTLSDLASSIISDGGSQSINLSKTLRLQGQIWITLSELYLTLNQVEEAQSCVRETSALFPLSHQVAYMRGQIFEHVHKFKEAKECYESAIALNPFHTKSLQHLGMVLHYLDNNKLAEKVLRDAVNADPTSDRSWYCLGVVLQALGQAEAAVNCHSTAIELETTNPIVSFTVIPRIMQ